MAKALLLSIIFAIIMLPARAARMKNARLGLRKTLVSLLVFNFFYVIALILLYGRL